MKVSTAKPFCIVYSLFQHQFLGYLFESFVVQLDDQNRLTLQHQNISAKNAIEFTECLDDADFELVNLIDEIQQDFVVKKFAPKRLTPADFFLKYYDAQKGDKSMQEAIDEYIEARKSKILALLPGKTIFEMSNDGEPTWKRLYMAEEKATVLFHFRRNENDTHYFPTIKYKGEKLDFQYKNAIILCKHPACLMLGDRLYMFAGEIDGQKLKPFLNKKFIIIPKSVEATYYSKFVAPLIASFDVYAKGFEIVTESHQPTAQLTFKELAVSKQVSLLAASTNAVNDESAEDNSQILFELHFSYGRHKFPFGDYTQASVSMEQKGDQYVFHKIKRAANWEREQVLRLKEHGLPLTNGKLSLPKAEAFDWLNSHFDLLGSADFQIVQLRSEGNKEVKYFLGKSTLNLQITENRDWFDIYGTVVFGPYEIPFLKLRNLILQKKKEFKLPNGEIAVIPEAWFTQYAEIFAFMETGKAEDEQLTLPKFHFSLVQNLDTEKLAEVSMSHKLEKLRDFKEIAPTDVPANFMGELRPYQKAGYDWMHFLNNFKFGGCLADDMGLGKTVQTLALLQCQKEAGQKQASLLVMPTSLVYNWEMEARKFTPKLKVLVYTGSNREKNIANFAYYDLILTSYGIVRMDVELLQQYRFNYVILDESQAIKNPLSNIAKAVKLLNAHHRLILTGTPLENSTMDLWSQMNFINPGLLGNQNFFKNEFLNPIEKKNDEAKLHKLHSIIKPFILRRHKAQVATELPAKFEHVHYAHMSEEQAKEYEEAKSYFRNKILEHIETKGMAQSQIMLLQGLTQLRQIANHPRMVNENYGGDSGKLEDVLSKLGNVIRGKHKVLIFSQFVKHLSIVREYLDKDNVAYAYLDGSTRNRQEQVEYFQQNEKVQVFLISLKAGGVGLNLTAADYVFILDPWWNPAVEAQAIDRAHRIGQDKRVFVYKFIAKDTVEEKILALQQNKQRLAGDLITTEESFVKTLTQTDIVELLG